MAKTGKTKKALNAPSTVSKKKLATYEPPKKRKLKPAGKAIVKDEPIAIDKKKRKATKKAVKKIASYKWGTNPDRDKVIHLNYMEYLKLHSIARYGNSELDPDTDGTDGYDSLRLLPYLKKTTKKKFANLLKDRDESIVKASVYNIWQWSNFCNRLWINTVDMSPPMRRIVNIDLADIFPGANQSGVLDTYVNLIKDNKDALIALRNLGLTRYKVRLNLSIKHSYNVSQKSLYKLFDMMQFTRADKSIWGITVDISKTDDYSAYPRDVVILKPNDLRKSSETLNYLSDAIDSKYRVILPYDIVKNKATKISEIKQSKLYRHLCDSWQGLSPLITMPIDSKMVRVNKVSKLSDILLN